MGLNLIFLGLHVVIAIAIGAPINTSAHAFHKEQVLTLFQNGSQDLERAFGEVYKHFEHTYAE